MRLRQFAVRAHRITSLMRTGCCRKYVVLLLFAVAVMMTIAGLRHVSKQKTVETAAVQVHVNDVVFAPGGVVSYSHVDIVFFYTEASSLT